MLRIGDGVLQIDAIADLRLLALVLGEPAIVRLINASLRYGADPRDARGLLTTAMELPVAQVLPHLRGLIDRGRITPTEVHEQVRIEGFTLTCPT